MLKVELHSHTADDPIDIIPHSTRELIERAASLGYDALAVTLHERQLDLEALRPFAAERGITLISGVERSIEGCHVLLLGFSPRVERLNTFEDLSRLRREERGLVVAPHPFFPMGACLGERLDRHAGLFDAVEVNAMFTSTLNFNRRAEQWAAAHGKPLVGNGDVHRLQQLGTTFTLVDAAKDQQSILDAIRAGRARIEGRPLSWTEAAAIMTSILAADVRRRLLGRDGLRTAHRSDAPATSA